jgi:hypothetical protein
VAYGILLYADHAYLLRLAKFPDKDFLLWHNFRYGEGKKEAREATEAPPEGGRPFRAG